MKSKEILGTRHQIDSVRLPALMHHQKTAKPFG